MHVAEAVGAWAGENLGDQGLGDVGAVIGATYPAEMAALRQALPHVVFLVPGFGTQGGAAADTAAAFRRDGTGAVINSSRGIIASFAPTQLIGRPQSRRPHAPASPGLQLQHPWDG